MPIASGSELSGSLVSGSGRRNALAYHPIELLHAWEMRTNRPRRREGDAELLGRWSAVGGRGLEPLAQEPELLLVVTTFGRPQLATRLLANAREALAAAGLTERAALLVLRDACGEDYATARRLAHDVCASQLWLDARTRFGKAGFWQVHQTALLAARAWRPRFALYLQDDVEFAPDLVTRARALWSATQSDPLRRVLYLFSSSDDEVGGRWVPFTRRPAGRSRLTNWFDLQAFFVDRAFFELLDYRMVPIHPNRWRRRPEQSSGVGRQLTRRLFGRAHVYQAWPPLVMHGVAPSTMNPEARRERPLDNRADYYMAAAGRSAA
jgi:hypothetical protein